MARVAERSQRKFPAWIRGATAEVGRAIGIGEQGGELCPQVVGTVGIGEKSRVADDLDLRRVIPRDHGGPAVHRFEHGQAEPLVSRREDERRTSD